MGWRNKSYQKTLHQQIHDRLQGMLQRGVGQSKADARARGDDGGRIHSYQTYKSYQRHCEYFAKYIKARHPECTNLKSAQKYVNEFLQARSLQTDGKTGKPLSAWTLNLERAALGKLYGKPPEWKAPARHRYDIQRSRGEAVRDKHFSEKNNRELVNFCRATGCRRNVLEKLQGRDLKSRADLYKEIRQLEGRQGLTQKEEKHLNTLKEAVRTFRKDDYFIHHRTDKGGRERYAPIVGAHKGEVVARMQATAPRDKVFQSVSRNADIHGYRGDYAVEVYREHARPLEKLTYKEIYACRADKAGEHYDRAAMKAASIALGHSRIDVIANNYLHG